MTVRISDDTVETMVDVRKLGDGLDYLMAYIEAKCAGFNFSNYEEDRDEDEYNALMSDVSEAAVLYGWTIGGVHLSKSGLHFAVRPRHYYVGLNYSKEQGE